MRRGTKFNIKADLLYRVLVLRVPRDRGRTRGGDSIIIIISLIMDGGGIVSAKACLADNGDGLRLIVYGL